ncbi:recombinase family protein (plasmid) [Sphingobium sp. RSMS]|uniref:recombinase family protein n=1 Tax=Sphingobium sp. RSMS TaxID=520734 RepID=UPI0020A2F142|nr:recombinase family protein [Sphingobium sp. RSMS]UXC93904.1 recombinase family protein [Sphingobium sp. RSMS]
MTRVGYARVSTIDQDLDIQVARLKAAGCEILRSETGSGASRTGRTELETIMQFLRADDELVVLRLDRLGRSTRDVLNRHHHATIQKSDLADDHTPFLSENGPCKPCDQGERKSAQNITPLHGGPVSFRAKYRAYANHRFLPYEKISIRDPSQPC